MLTLLQLVRETQDLPHIELEVIHSLLGAARLHLKILDPESGEDELITAVVVEEGLVELRVENFWEELGPVGGRTEGEVALRKVAAALPPRTYEIREAWASGMESIFTMMASTRTPEAAGGAAAGGGASV